MPSDPVTVFEAPPDLSPAATEPSAMNAVVSSPTRYSAIGLREILAAQIQFAEFARASRTSCEASAPAGNRSAVCGSLSLNFPLGTPSIITTISALDGEGDEPVEPGPVAGLLEPAEPAVVAPT